MASKNKFKVQDAIGAQAMKAERLAAQQKKESELASLALAASPDMTPGDVPRNGNPVTLIEDVDTPTKAPKDQMTDDEVSVFVSRAIESAISWNSDQENYRVKAQQYFDAKAVGDLSGSGISGRSEFVSSDVADTIEAAVPAIIETFLASGSIVEFNAKKPSDEDAAASTTDLVNHIFLSENNGFQILSEWVRDALLMRMGIVAVRWDESDGREREEYQGQTDVQLGLLMSDPEIEIVSLVQYPDPEALRAAEQAQLQQQQAYDAFMASQPPEQPTQSLDDVHAAISAMTQGQGATV